MGSEILAIPEESVLKVCEVLEEGLQGSRYAPCSEDYDPELCERLTDWIDGMRKYYDQT